MDPIEITAAEVANWLTAAELGALAVDAAYCTELAAYLSGQLTTAAVAAEPALYEAVRAGLTGAPNPEKIRAAAALAERQAKQITGNLAQAELNKIGQIVAENIAAGKNPRDIIGTLRGVVTDLDAPRAKRLDKFAQYVESLDLPADRKSAMIERQKQKLLRDRTETIARTEQRFATSEGNLLEAESRGARFKVAISARDARVSDICQENEAAGPIPIDEPFPSGDMTPPFHPNCRCTLAYQTTEAQRARSEKRAAARAEQTAAAKTGEPA